MEKKISFIHCADLHLDSPFKGMTQVPAPLFKQIRDCTFQSLTALVETAIDKKVDFILIAGDLFDDNKQSLKAHIRLKKAFTLLKKYGITVYLSFGNHDYAKAGKAAAEYPDNVIVFKDDKVSTATFTKSDRTLATIYGFSYGERAVKENKTVEYQRTDDKGYHIAMLHGSLSTNTEHDVYAPFQLGDLISKNFDYWALGHIHKRQILSEDPPVVYPGNLQGRSKKETGEKGCYYVELSEAGTHMEFFPLQEIRFETVAVDISSVHAPEEVEAMLEHMLSEKKKELGKCILQIRFTSDQQHVEDWYQTGYFEEIIELLNDSIDSEDTWGYIQDYSFVRKQSLPGEWEKSHHFAGELKRRFTETDRITPYLKPITHHKHARKYLEPFSPEEEEQIKLEAQNLLIHELTKEYEG
ncbi:metallophosphoesterase family protein [Sediminibacillus massiliensis]|uniref:metallophosphoesterase family protein n=1 Tax=Sediminibacillus massiliensis TaxID=1926277 RepID=UPI0009885483|nr:DNA repair exonuclease [Sediminibacillus massiliensis]